jgi:twinkle protein|tara:strand:- start:1407 stop:3107 length:1701 start_codon:yes stop_codon:yes gene_type:complete
MAFAREHLPCPLCGSSDALSENHDGSAKCFSCASFIPAWDYKEHNKENPSPTPHLDNNRNNNIRHINSSEEFIALKDRGISLNTAKKYGVKATHNAQGVILKHFYPYYDERATKVATKERAVHDKGFFWSGAQSESCLFGQQLFNKGGKFLTITEGECDAMAAYELLGSKWPVVSIKSGAQSAVKDIKENLEYIESFENVVIAFDMDKHGQAAAKKVARLLKPSKAKIMLLPETYKDPNDLLLANQHQLFVRAFWDAKTYTPSGVLSVSENREKYKNRPKHELVLYPWQGLNRKLEGLRRGELVVVAGGTGLGKTSVTRELEHWLISSTKDKIGILSLEESYQRTVDGILSIEANVKLHIHRIRDQYSEEDIDKWFDAVYVGENRANFNRVWIHAHYGETDLDVIFSKLRFMIIGCDCKWIFIDHLHMMFTGAAPGEEQIRIAAIMKELTALIAETGVGIILVSHLRRIDGNKGHENGIETGLNHLRGSHSIAQQADCVIGLERNQQSEDPLEASTTKVRVLKSRYTGDVGVATHLLYDNDTGRISEIDTDDVAHNLEEETTLGFE